MTFHDKTEKNHPKKSTLWLFNSSPWKITMLLSSVNHLFRLGPSIPWRTVSHNQRVIQKWSNYPQFPAGMTLHSWGPKLWRKPSIPIESDLNLLTYWEKPDFLFKKKPSNDEGPQVLVFFHTVNLSQKGAGSRCKWATNHLWSAQYHLPKFHRNSLTMGHMGHVWHWALRLRHVLGFCDGM